MPTLPIKKRVFITKPKASTKILASRPASKKTSILSVQDDQDSVSELDPHLADKINELMLTEFGKKLQSHVIDYEQLRQKEEKSKVKALAGNSDKAIVLALRKIGMAFLVVGTPPRSPVGLVGTAATFLSVSVYARNILGCRAVKLVVSQDTAIYLLPIPGERGTPEHFFHSVDSYSPQPTALSGTPAEAAAQPPKSTLEELGALLNALTSVPGKVCDAVNANIVAKLEAANKDAQAAQEMGAEVTSALRDICGTAQRLVEELKEGFTKVQQERQALASERVAMQQVLKEAKTIHQRWEDQAFGRKQE